MTIHFRSGAPLPDPDGVLEGGGKQGRFIRLNDAHEIDEPKTAPLIATAVRQARVPVTKTGQGYTVVKSIAATQRPRRA